MTQKHETELRSLLTLAHQDHHKGLIKLSLFKLNDKEISEDIVQDTFMKTWRYLVRGGKIDLMKAFLYHILNDLVVDEYRKRKPISLDALLDKGFDPSAGDVDRLMNELDGREAARLIMKLPQKYQKIMLMRYVRDLTLEEMSLITGDTRNAVAVQAHRGLERLKKIYGRL